MLCHLRIRSRNGKGSCSGHGRPGMDYSVATTWPTVESLERRPAPNQALVPAKSFSEPTKFNFNGNDLTVITDETGKAWFVGNEVAEILGYKFPKTAVRDHCKHSKLLKGVESTSLTSSPRGIKIIPEGDLYRLITKSKLPAAEKFKRWVTHEVLPYIRQPQHPDTNTASHQTV